MPKRQRQCLEWTGPTAKTDVVGASDDACASLCGNLTNCQISFIYLGNPDRYQRYRTALCAKP